MRPAGEGEVTYAPCHNGTETAALDTSNTRKATPFAETEK